MNSRRAFTLIEALLAAVILAMAIMAITMPFTVGAQNEQEDARRSLAVSLAQEMMEEILSKPFEDPDGHTYTCGPDPGEPWRSKFDNIDDYDGYTEASGNITSFDGEVVTTSASLDLTRHVTATYVYVSGQDTLEDPCFIRVVVEVRYRGNPVVTLTRLVYALYEGGGS